MSSKLHITSVHGSIPAYIYFVQAGYIGPIKIGVAQDVDKRIKDLQVGNHMALLLIAKIGPFSETHAYCIEKNLHKKFRKHHVRGEWFSRNINLKDINELSINENPSDHLDSIIGCELRA